ncbi:MAG: hypothetical protein A2539_04380 [Elusimicrobia bacterium RIFOXYD2_FULL_34_15]|nr:MAG: hypothetical protein A2539_04380 [Elusimicrobia bacterium RIFOXYD2_FULL_34_15]
MKKLTNQEKGALLIITVVGLWAYWKYLYSPITREITGLQSELSEKQAKLEATRQAAQELEVLQAEFKIIEIEAREMEKKLPKSKDLPKLIRDITRAMERHRINAQSFTPSKEIQKTYFSEIPITLAASCNYHNLANFIADIGQFERIINTFDVVMTPKQATKESPDSLTVNFRLATYMAK